MTLPVDGPNTDGVVLAAGDIPTIQVGATTARLVATGALTEGRYGLFRWDMSATSGGASPHYHKTFSEAFYVLGGRIGLYDGRDWREGGPGDFLYLPPGGIHAFRNDSGAAASMLILFAPGPPREDYFRELAERVTSGHHGTDEERTAFLAQHDQYEV
ncbi:MAG TPA: cupin domain-containing protein [Candidatus Limnocylindrales bacterium]|nr:cupin domain-containing protein [Candidatus Limnocylindrales bacterium]